MFHWKNLCLILIFFGGSYVKIKKNSLRFSLKKLNGILLLLFSFVRGFQIYLQFKGDHEINI